MNKRQGCPSIFIRSFKLEGMCEQFVHRRLKELFSMPNSDISVRNISISKIFGEILKIRLEQQSSLLYFFISRYSF